MAKFSIHGDEDEDEDEDEEFITRSPKRRRISQPLPSAPPVSADVEPTQQEGHPPQQPPLTGGEDDVTRSPAAAVEGEGEGPARPGLMSMILSDPDVLDCSICYEPLTIPVFQCDNGHIACSSCCIKLGDKCPSCCGKIGYNRCRAIEKVIESVRVPCCYLSYGCRETVSYCKKLEHEEICIYAPCTCPFTDCIFRGSPGKLSQHMYHQHKDLVVRFSYNSMFSVSVGLAENFIVLLEEEEGVLFILTLGNALRIRCIHPSPSNGRFAYDLVTRNGESSLRFQSFTRSTVGHIRDPPSADYFLVPGYFYLLGHLDLDICIWSKDSSQSDITQNFE